MDKIIPISELQTQARRIIAGVKDAGDPVIITQRGRPAAMLVNYQDYEGVIATLEEMSEPDWRERLTEAERDSRRGRGVDVGEFRARRAKRVSGKAR